MVENKITLFNLYVRAANVSMTATFAKITIQTFPSSRLYPLIRSPSQPLRWAIDQPVEYFCGKYSYDKAYGKAGYICTCNCPLLRPCEVKP